MSDIYPLFILAIGIITIVGMITILKVNAFISLITSALVVSLMAPGELTVKVSRVAEAFGAATGKIGIVIALAVVIGKCMMDSGAADRIVRAFLHLLGEKRMSIALMSSGFTLSIPVFFDTVFYLLVPLARSTFKRTKAHYVRYVIAIAAGAAVTHSLVPPTPGPLVMAQQLNIDLGMMIMIGLLVSIPAAIVGLAYAHWCDRRMNIPMRSMAGGEAEPEPIPDEKLPSLFVSVLPIVLPVILVSLNTIVGTLADGAPETSIWMTLSPWTALIGNANLAMLLSAAIAMLTLVAQRGMNRQDMAKVVESSLMSGGVIILITAGGGAFGAMLKVAGIGDAIQSLFASGPDQALSGWLLLFLGFFISSLMKISQGSGTVAMITASAMVAEMLPASGNLGYHPVLLATAIGSGSMVCSWMNDSGFWIVARMGGFTEGETIRTWTAMLALTGVAGFLVTLLLAAVLPL